VLSKALSVNDFWEIGHYHLQLSASHRESVTAPNGLCPKNSISTQVMYRGGLTEVLLKIQLDTESKSQPRKWPNVHAELKD